MEPTPEELEAVAIFENEMESAGPPLFALEAYFDPATEEWNFAGNFNPALCEARSMPLLKSLSRALAVSDLNDVAQKGLRLFAEQLGGDVPRMVAEAGDGASPVIPPTSVYNYFRYLANNGATGDSDGKE